MTDLPAPKVGELVDVHFRGIVIGPPALGGAQPSGQVPIRAIGHADTFFNAWVWPEALTPVDTETAADDLIRGPS